MSDETFLARWMRRKAAARKGAEVPAEEREPREPAMAPAVSTPVAASETAAPPAQPASGTSPGEGEQTAQSELPPLEELRDIASEYRDFMRPEVDKETRMAALKRLFHDPHFNRMDGLDVYIDDYTQPDPIPPAMLAGLQHARSLLFDEPIPQAPVGESTAAGETSAETTGTEADTTAAGPEIRASEDSPVANEGAEDGGKDHAATVKEPSRPT